MQPRQALGQFRAVNFKPGKAVLGFGVCCWRNHSCVAAATVSAAPTWVQLQPEHGWGRKGWPRTGKALSLSSALRVTVWDLRLWFSGESLSLHPEHSESIQGHCRWLFVPWSEVLLSIPGHRCDTWPCFTGGVPLLLLLMEMNRSTGLQ